MARVTGLYCSLLLVGLQGCKVMQGVPGCEQFRTGKFAMQAEPDGVRYIVTRDDSIQTEHNLQTGKIVRMKVNWTSPCSYELTLLSTNEFVTDPSQEYAKTHPLQVKIIKRAKDYYIFTAKMEGVNLRMKDTLRVSL